MKAPNTPHWFRNICRNMYHNRNYCNKNCRKSLSSVGILVVAGTFTLLLLLMQQSAQAHEASPTTKPILPACHVADLRCVQSVESLNFHSFPQIQSTDVLTSTRIQDGKWLQLMPGLINAAHHTTVRTEPIYAVPCVDGFADVYPCNNVDLLAHLPYEVIGGKANNDSWGWRDTLTDREYALIGAKDGTVILDITVPETPRYMGKLPTHSTSSSWRDLKVYQDHLFVVADYNPEHGMQVFDLRTLRSVQHAATPVVFQESAHYSDFDYAHNLAINEESGFAYVVGTDTCGGGLHIVDIRTATAPVGVGCYREDGYIHDTTCAIYRGPDQRYQGHELCFNASVNAFTVVDVTDKTAPTRIGSYSSETNYYIHQGWLTDDQRYFVMNDELDELRTDEKTRTFIINIETLDAPYLAGTYSTGLSSIDHNLYIDDSYIYEANYTTGLRLLDGKNLALGELTEVASFDTYPQNNEASFDGAWTAYPYFRSGVVVVSTIESGVFILKPKLSPDVIIEKNAETITLCQPDPAGTAIYSKTLALTARNGYTQTTTLAIDSTTPVRQTPAITPTLIVSPTVLNFQADNEATTTLIADLSTMAAGTYSATLHVHSPKAVELDQQTIIFHVMEEKATMPPVTAVAQQIGTQLNLTFTWPSTANATGYNVEIALDEAFTQKLYQANTTAIQHHVDTAIGLNQTYFWRVTPLNGCGAGHPTSGSGETEHGVFLPLIAKP